MADTKKKPETVTDREAYAAHMARIAVTRAAEKIRRGKTCDLIKRIHEI